MANRHDIQNIHYCPPAAKKDEKKPSDVEKAFQEALGVMAASVVFVLVIIGLVTVIESLCRCR